MCRKFRSGFNFDARVSERAFEYTVGKVSILIVSYNTREMTLACLRSIFAETQSTSFELTVVDNESGDGSADAIAAEFPRVRLIRSERNLGFAAANNLATQDATGEYLLLLNPDTIVLRGAIDKLLAFAKAHPSNGIWGGRTLFADGSLNLASCWARPTPWSLFCLASGLTALFRGSRFFNPEAYGSWQRDTVREVDIVSGCFLLIRKDLWDRHGGFDPAFFMYGEEADLCLRARKSGVKPMITPEATIIHYGGASERVRSDKLVRLLHAKALLIRRHWDPGWVPFGLVSLMAWALIRAVAWSVLRILFRKTARSEAEQWWSVWARRSQWLQTSTGS